MKEMKSMLLALHNDEDGAGATEYIILLILIACVVIAIVKTFGETIQGKFKAANDGVEKQVKF